MNDYPPLPMTLARPASSSDFGYPLVVRTRFVPPTPRPQVIPRPRLDQLLERLTDYPFILLRGDPGYGKTTAIASFLAQSNVPYFWYSLSDGDIDPLIFLVHLVHLFRPVYPEVGERALELLAQEGGAARYWAPAVDALTNSLLDTLARDTILVLDDYCVVNHPEIDAITERLIEHMPPRLHLVITARALPSLPGRARWRASGELLEIGRSDLAFTLDEIRALFEQQTGQMLTVERARALAVETEGWPIALHLLSKGSHSGQIARLDDPLHRLPGPSELLFNYLAEEVFLRQPPAVQNFLAETSILRRLDPDVCNHLLGREDAASILCNL
ncbi:MAG: hypothetical protein ACRDIB_13780, partial [Ardenticatenaceae bacterium]